MRYISKELLQIHLKFFFWAVTRKIPAPISIDDASKQIELFIRSWEVLRITPLVVIEVVRGVKDRQHYLNVFKLRCIIYIKSLLSKKSRIDCDFG